MPVTFVRLKPFPNCKHCGLPMGYYIPGLPDKDHAHPSCAGKAMAEESMKKAIEAVFGGNA